MGVIFKNSVMYNSSNILNYPVCYSEEEREIGCWTDGKPLYQTTIHTGALTKDGNWHSIAHNIPNIDKIILCTGTVYAADNTAYFMPNYRPGLTQGICLDATNTDIEYIQNWLDSSPDSYITLQYTKTTDQPGSGSWTPQEIPAQHYSTNEQIIGTWIDGNILYEKTIVVPNFFTTISEWGWYGGQIDISSMILNISQSFPILEKSYITLGDTTTRQPCYIDCQVPSGPVVYFPGSSRSGTLTLTIQYTKASS